jgi:formate C-acetyltransferase
MEDLVKLSILIRTYFSRNGKHIQFNVVDRNTLISAQQAPENYRDLIVRVAGYSAYFVQLGKPMQDEIIGRTEHLTAG